MHSQSVKDVLKRRFLRVHSIDITQIFNILQGLCRQVGYEAWTGSVVRWGRVAWTGGQVATGGVAWQVSSVRGFFPRGDGGGLSFHL